MSAPENLNTDGTASFLFKKAGFAHHHCHHPSTTIMHSSSISQSDSARAQLRHALTEYFHAQPVAAPRGYHSWPVAAPAASPDAASPDSVVLMVRDLLCISQPVTPKIGETNTPIIKPDKPSYRKNMTKR